VAVHFLTLRNGSRKNSRSVKIKSGYRRSGLRDASCYYSFAGPASKMDRRLEL